MHVSREKDRQRAGQVTATCMAALHVHATDEPLSAEQHKPATVSAGHEVAALSGTTPSTFGPDSDRM